MKKLNNSKALNNFENKIEETNDLMLALEAQVHGMKIFAKHFKFKEDLRYEKLKKYVEITKKQEEKLYELGFVSLFANFECFIFELLKELYKKHPASYKSEKTVKFEDIRSFDTLEEVRNYFIDSLAIEKTYEIETWLNVLRQKFKIQIFESTADLKRFKSLNSLRNLILHSGNKTNSKFRNEMKGFLKTPVPLGKEFTPDRKAYFRVLYTMLKKMVTKLKKSNEKI